MLWPTCRTNALTRIALVDREPRIRDDMLYQAARIIRRRRQSTILKYSQKYHDTTPYGNLSFT